MLAVQRRSLLNQPLDTVGLEFTRLGVAYDHMGRPVGSNVPRFEHRVPNLTVKNELPGNVSDGGDTSNPELFSLNIRTGTDHLGDTAGFFPNGSEGLTSVTDEHHSGSRSLKVEGTANYYSGVRMVLTTTAADHIFGVWVKAPTGRSDFELLVNSSSQSFTTTGDWQFVEIKVACPADATWLSVRYTSNVACTFYVDDLRLGKNDVTGITAKLGTETLSVTGQYAYQGYRSFKCHTLGTALYEGMYFNTTTVIAGAKYCSNVRVKAPNGQPMYCKIYDLSSGFVVEVDFTGNGDWQRIDNFITMPSDKTGLRFNIATNSQASIDFFVDCAMLETGSVIHDWAYGGSSYSTYKTEYGCYIGEAVTNGASANISTGGDTLGNTTGFLSVNGVENITYSTDEKIQGNGSIKVVVDGSNLGDGIKANLGVTANIPNTFQMWVKFEKGVPFKFEWNSSINYWTGTGDWQFIYSTQTPVSTPKPFYLKSLNPSGATFYIDLIQSTPTAYPLPQDWTLGGTSKQAETLTAPANSLNIDTSGATPNQGTGTIELEVFNNLSFDNSVNIRHLISHASINNSSLNRIILRRYSGALTNFMRLTFSNNSGSTNQTQSGYVLPINSWSKQTHRWDYISAITTIDSSTVTLLNPYLPTAAPNIIYIGSWIPGTLQCNTIIRNLIISRQKRSDSDVTARASLPEGKAPRPDRGTMLYAPLMYDLKAYRVRA